MPRAFIACVAMAACILASGPAAAQEEEAASVDRICTLIADQAKASGVPDALIARLFFLETAFDPAYTSPTGATGVAKFNAIIAESERLSDASDIELAIPAAVNRIAALNEGFGNLGLALAAYQGGEKAVRRWIDGKGYLPVSTMIFLRKMTGENPDHFRDPKAKLDVRPLETRFGFADACRRLPLIASGDASLEAPSEMPWAVVVGSGIDIDAAMTFWSAVKERTGFRIGGGKVYVMPVAAGMGRRSHYSVRIGSETRGGAQAICSKLRGLGGACMVARNGQTER
ncbi:transglycosylase SLT domain-containing protein [Pseudohoeflea suaedae]|uniref:transglycosylase SLT domain-containing protein n=1 Tax=Pseudohoeflea suaedae TaxID=877384 RepID=UPI001304B103|nr:transglycosylase SLT domain-containing protein [Pseudohoeflea suaedae]